MKTRAARRGDGYVIQGAKNWITNGPECDAIILFVSTDAAAGAKGTSAFNVDRGTKGFIVGGKDHKLGIRGSPSCTVSFDECVVPAENRLGAEGDGFKIGMGTLDGGRIGIAAQALGIGRADFEVTLAWSKERRAFGKVISEHQAIQHKLADMATQLEAARLLTWRAAYMKDKGMRHSRESAMAKLYASEAASKVANQALQIFGGYGFARLLAATRAHAGLALWSAGDRVLANVSRVLDLARTFESSAGATSFRAFVESLDDHAEQSRHSEAPVTEEGTERVRVMTVHAAKGLEFPDVILCDPTAPAQAAHPSRYIDAERHVWLEQLAFCTPIELREHEALVLRRDAEEIQGLVYVAATRARDVLVVPVIGDETTRQQWLEPLTPVVYPAAASRRRPTMQLVDPPRQCQRRLGDRRRLVIRGRAGHVE